jgi:hypothetical protein
MIVVIGKCDGLAMAQGNLSCPPSLEIEMAERDASKPLKDFPVIQAETPPGSPPARTGLDAEVQAHIGRQLRAVYDDVANEPIPDKFLQLLRDLDQKRDAKRDGTA